MGLLLDAGTALAAFLSLLMLPATLMLALGIFLWYRGRLQSNEDRIRLGKMLTMMGIIFLTILLITSGFLNQILPGS
jgi:hypothetical protein